MYIYSYVRIQLFSKFFNIRLKRKYKLKSLFFLSGLEITK